MQEERVRHSIKTNQERMVRSWFSSQPNALLQVNIQHIMHKHNGKWVKFINFHKHEIYYDFLKLPALAVLSQLPHYRKICIQSTQETHRCCEVGTQKA